MKTYKYGVILIMVCLSFGIFSGCSSESKDQVQVSTQKEADLKAFTLDELKKYNGKDGNPVYVAVDGVVYDFTDLKSWKNGEHNGFEAGNDLTEAIKNKSPHGTSVLKKAKVVGKLQ